MKMLRKLKIEENFFNMIKLFVKNLQLKSYSKVKGLKVFPLRPEKHKGGDLLSQLLLSIVVEVLPRATRQGGKKGHLKWKGSCKMISLSLYYYYFFCRWHESYTLKIPKNSQWLIKQINEFSKVAGKTNTPESLLYL